MFRRLVVSLCALLPASAIADVHGTVRVGVMPLELRASEDTALFGRDVEDAVMAYNAVARATGAAPIETRDLSLSETLLVLAPGFDAGGDRLYFRLEGQLGIGDDMRTFGFGLYPLNVRARVHRSVEGYISLGGSASWLDRNGSGDRGALLAARGAVGAKLGKGFLVELGWSAFAVGGSVDRARVEQMIDARELPTPKTAQEAVVAGDGSSVVDVSVGFAF